MIKLFQLVELDRLTKSLNDQDPNALVTEWNKMEGYMEKYWKMKSLLWNLERLS